jgi:3-dehydroquinate synthase
MASCYTNKYYSIYIDNSLKSLDEFLVSNEGKYSSYYILVDENTHSLAIPQLLKKVPKLQMAEILEVDAGEKYKNLHTASVLWEALLENNADRNTLLINLGGGMITDLGGFVASVFKRGISFINIPTTLLSMTDAAIGSKTGIDFQGYKNQIGSFAHPQAVFINTEFINTLKEEEIYSGMGEVLKYSLISDSKLWDVLKDQSISNELDFEIIVAECVNIKNTIVDNDWTEKGERKILNFGHTIGHALESFSMSKSRRHLTHGEAIACGILVELELSVKKFNFDSSTHNRIQQYILENFDLFPISDKDFDRLISIMRKDKKNTNSEISFVLLHDIGKAEYGISVSESEIIEALNYYANL